MTKALITGITGQDGYYLAQQLIAEGVEVIGLVRDVAQARAAVADLGGDVRLIAFDFMQAGLVTEVITETAPDYIFNYAAKSSGQGMFDAPTEMARLNAGFALDILHAMIASPRRERIRFVQASSSEMYGSNDQMPQNEESAFRPISPYGAAKLYVHNMIGIYRNMHDLHASSAILFNHESPRRSEAFVTKKIANAAARIKLGQLDRLRLGNTSSRRDWGYAPEYADAMYRMARHAQGDDYVVATGRMHGLVDVLEMAFGAVGLSYCDYLDTDPDAMRRIDSKGHCGDPGKIRRALGWTSTKPLQDIIVEMVETEVRKFGG